MGAFPPISSSPHPSAVPVVEKRVCRPGKAFFAAGVVSQFIRKREWDCSWGSREKKKNARWLETGKNRGTRSEERGDWVLSWG